MPTTTDLMNGRMVATIAVQARYLDATEVAKVARKRLKAAFPQVAFSVRTSKYSMGSSLRVNWTDGPTVKMVDAIVGDLDGSTFDGMVDMKSSKGDQRLPEFDEPVRLGNDYIFTNRTISPALDALVRRHLATRWTGLTPGYETDNMRYRLLGRAMVIDGNLALVKDEY